MRLLEKTQMDNLSSMTKAHDEGKEEGRQEGLAEDLERGEHNAKIATARNMIQDGLHVEVVAKYIGLTIDKVRLL